MPAERKASPEKSASAGQKEAFRQKAPSELESSPVEPNETPSSQVQADDQQNSVSEETDAPVATAPSADGENASRTEESGTADRKTTGSNLPAQASSEAGIEIFTWGNVTAILLLAGGCGLAAYLRWGDSHQDRTTGPLAPVGRLPLGQAKDVRLVRCGEEILLLAITDDSISLLRSYPSDEFEDSSLQVPDAEEKTAIGEDARAVASAALGGKTSRREAGSFSNLLMRLRG